MLKTLRPATRFTDILFMVTAPIVGEILEIRRGWIPAFEALGAFLARFQRYFFMSGENVIGMSRKKRT